MLYSLDVSTRRLGENWLNPISGHRLGASASSWRVVVQRRDAAGAIPDGPRVEVRGDKCGRAL